MSSSKTAELKIGTPKISIVTVLTRGSNGPDIAHLGILPKLFSWHKFANIHAKYRGSGHKSCDIQYYEGSTGNQKRNEQYFSSRHIGQSYNKADKIHHNHTLITRGPKGPEPLT